MPQLYMIRDADLEFVGTEDECADFLEQHGIVPLAGDLVPVEDNGDASWQAEQACDSHQWDTRRSKPHS